MSEHISKAIQQFQNQNLETFQNQSLRIVDSNEISAYTGELTKKNLAIQTDRILKMFPKIPLPMLDELKNAFADNNFTDERIKDAVDYVRDTYEGWDKLPNIANFIQYDKKIKIYSWKESIEIGQQYLIAVDLGFNNPKWVLKEDQKKYKLKLWKKIK